MSRYHVVYVTKLGVPFIEEAQEHSSEVGALAEAVKAFAPTYDQYTGDREYDPVVVKTHEGKFAVLHDYDHLSVMTPEELQGILQREAEARGLPFTEDDDS